MSGLERTREVEIRRTPIPGLEFRASGVPGFRFSGFGFLASGFWFLVSGFRFAVALIERIPPLRRHELNQIGTQLNRTRIQVDINPPEMHSPHSLLRRDFCPITGQLLVKLSPVTARFSPPACHYDVAYRRVYG